MKNESLYKFNSKRFNHRAAVGLLCVIHDLLHVLCEVTIDCSTYESYISLQYIVKG